MVSTSTSSIEYEFTAENVRVSASAGKLEAVFAYPVETQPESLAVIVGPHPLLGGDMDNNIVEALANGLAAKGMATLRFNYAGVGMSDGADFRSAKNLESFWKTNRTSDEADRWQDLESAIRFAREATEKTLSLGLVAYSFGNYVTSEWLKLSKSTAPDEMPNWFFCVAPTVDKHDLNGLAVAKAPRKVIAPADDFATPIEVLTHAVGAWKSPVKTVITERDGHFFRGHESWLCRECYEFSNECKTDGETHP